MNKLVGLLTAALVLGACGKAKVAQAPDESALGADRAEVRVVGSSTIYPFAQKVGETFQAAGGAKVVVESTGTVAGQAQFCAGMSMDTPDIVMSSREQSKTESDACQSKRVDEIIQAQLGFDGIVVAQSKSAAQTEFSINDFYSALAKTVPTSNYDCTPIPNPNKKWSDVNPKLPDTPILVYGPPPSSGTRDVFVQVALEAGAKRIACLDAMSNKDNPAFVKLVHEMRDDGAWVDAGENDSEIVQKLASDPKAYGVFGYAFVVENPGVVQSAKISGTEPAFENIASGKYKLSRPLYLYIKKKHIARLPAIKEFALAFLSDEAAGEAGYLKPLGLVPLSAAELAKSRAAVEAETVMQAVSAAN